MGTTRETHIGTVTDTAMSPSNSVVGINSSGNDVSLSTGGLLTIGSGAGEDITAAGAKVVLDSSGGAAQAPGSSTAKPA